MWLTDLAKLADPKYGLTVRFVDGWRTRGASGGAQMKEAAGGLWHHTAGSRKGNNPSRNVLINGRKGLSGPLCHINFARDGVVEVVAAGKANHAGKGDVDGIPENTGNTRLVGVEMESSGVKHDGEWDWTEAQLREMPKLGAALNDIFGWSSSQHWGHLEYSSTGKIDPAGLPGGMSGLRARIAATSIGKTVADTNRPWRTSTRVEGMTPRQIRGVQAHVGVTQDGVYGDATGTAVRDLQQALDLTADGVWGPTTERHVMALADDVKAIRTRTDAYLDGKISHVGRYVLDEKVTLKGGAFEGKASSARTKVAWLDHERETGETAIRAELDEIRGTLARIETALTREG